MSINYNNKTLEQARGEYSCCGGCWYGLMQWLSCAVLSKGACQSFYLQLDQTDLIGLEIFH